MFNDRPVHGKDFLVSVSGDRQVLTIPEVGDAHVGTISCVAENAAGRAICSAKVEIGKLMLYTHTLLICILYIFLLITLFIYNKIACIWLLYFFLR